MSQDLVIQKQYETHPREPSEECICRKQRNDN
jgi:hypothetical protein